MKAFLALLAISVVPFVPILHAASALPIPTAGVYLGVWANPNSAKNQEAAIELLEGASGINRLFALHLSYYGWTDLSQLLTSAGVFQPDTALAGDIAHGRVPVISWIGDRKTADSDHIVASGDPTEDTNIAAGSGGHHRQADTSPLRVRFEQYLVHLRGHQRSWPFPEYSRRECLPGGGVSRWNLCGKPRRQTWRRD